MLTTPYPTLLNLEKEGKIAIFRYPNVPKGYSTGKSDIIQQAVDWTLDFGEKYLDLTEQYHPDILSVVIENLKKSDYSPDSEKWVKEFEK